MTSCRVTWEFEVPEGGGWLLNYPLASFDAIADATYSRSNPMPDGLEGKKKWFLEKFNECYGKENDVIGVAMSDGRNFDVFYVDLLFASRADAMLFKLGWDGGAA